MKRNGLITILQARMGSSRLPGKVMLPLLGLPVVARQIERLKRSVNTGTIVLATSINEIDDKLYEFAQDNNLFVFRGELNDVLDRFYRAAKNYDAKHIIRITGDCPLIDPSLVDKVVTHHINNELDYTSNIDPPTWPDGLDVEVIKFSALQAAWEHSTEIYDREHVTSYIRNKKQEFHCGNITNPKGDKSPIRWTLDEPEDYIFLKAIYEDLYPSKPNFTSEDVMSWMEANPDKLLLNSHFRRNSNCLEKNKKRD